jgi:hypothetical protein
MSTVWAQSTGRGEFFTRNRQPFRTEGARGWGTPPSARQRRATSPRGGRDYLRGRGQETGFRSGFFFLRLNQRLVLSPSGRDVSDRSEVRERAFLENPHPATSATCPPSPTGGGRGDWDRLADGVLCHLPRWGRIRIKGWGDGSRWKPSHPRACGDPAGVPSRIWIPAFAGMTKRKITASLLPPVASRP